MFLLRAIQIGLRISDLDVLEVGEVLDMIAESGNDSFEYKQVATQEDFDRW